MYGPAVPFIKGIYIFSQGAAASFIKDIPIPPAASLLKGIYMYWKERPALQERIYVWSGRHFYKGNLYFTSRSGRFFHKEYTEPSGRLFAKGNLYLLQGAAAPLRKEIYIFPQGAAASFIKDIPIPPAASLLKGIYMYWKERPAL